MAKGRTKRSVPQARPRVKTATRPDLSVIILNYNTKKLAADCVASVLANRGAVNAEILVVDNASSDGSATALKKKFGSKIKLIAAARNLGFGPGNNLGAKEATGDYLLFLNSDTLVLPDALELLVAFADYHPEYGVLSPKILLADKKTVQPASFGQLPSLWNLLWRNSSPRRPQFDPQFSSLETEWVTGAALFIPREVFAAVGGFDSRFFMYFEDQDLCASVRKLGHRVAVVPDAAIIHLGGRSLPSSQKRYAYYDQSQELYFLKHYGAAVTALMVLLRFPWKLLRMLRSTKS